MMTNSPGNEKIPTFAWETECSRAARDRVRRRLGDAIRRSDKAEAILARRSRGKTAPNSEGEVIALRFSAGGRGARSHH
jgi:hypothetical protein